MQRPDHVALPAMLVPRPVLKAEEVAIIMGYASAAAFLEAAKRRLEPNGFPKKLPGMNAWSWPAIERWLIDNGRPQPSLPAAANPLERRYA